MHANARGADSKRRIAFLPPEDSALGHREKAMPLRIAFLLYAAACFFMLGTSLPSAILLGIGFGLYWYARDPAKAAQGQLQILLGGRPREQHYRRAANGGNHVLSHEAAAAHVRDDVLFAGVVAVERAAPRLSLRPQARQPNARKAARRTNACKAASQPLRGRIEGGPSF